MITRLLLIALAALFMAGCRTTMWLDRDITQPRSFWRQYGGSPTRAQASDVMLRPPLRLLWTESLSGGQSRGSALCSDSSLLVPGLTGAIDVLDVATGETVGGIPFAGTLEGTPVFLDSLLVLPFSLAEAQLAAVNLRTLRPVWKLGTGPIDVPLLRIGARIVAVTREGRVLCLAPGDTTLLWEARMPAQIRTPAAAADSTIIVTTTGGDMTALALAHGDERWRVPTGAAFTSSPAVADDIVIGVNRAGVAHAVEALTGRVLWRRDLAIAVHASPAVAREAAIIACASGDVVCLDLRTGAERWRTALGTVISAAPLLTRAHVVAATSGGRLCLLDRTTGAIVWSEHTRRRIRTTPIICGGRLVITDSEQGASVYASEGDAP
jgi:outer membrane protein assembly factor BamB